MTSTSAPSQPIDNDASPGADPGEADQTGGSASGNQAGRETAESLIYAVILALLFRVFVAEMFVIPTGSMASTLRGQHVAVDCQACGIEYHVNASRETRNFDFNGDGQLSGYELQQQLDSRVTQVGCPNCGAARLLDPDNVKAERSRSGDRIVVNKAVYDFSSPQRWDVIVFKFPGNAKQNYIKRLVGLPHELVKIWRGNVYTTPELFALPLSHQPALEAGLLTDELRAAFEQHGITLESDANIPAFSDISPSSTEEGQNWALRMYSGSDSFLLIQHEQQIYVYRDDFRIVRKPETRLLAMLQLVHDQNYVPTELHRAGYPLRWSGPGWQAGESLQSFSIAPAEEKPQWLRYRHWALPTLEQWEAVERGDRLDPDSLPTVGSLIMDYYAYNFLELGPHHWVGELAVEASIKVADHQQGAVWLELVRGGTKYRCRFDLATGKAELTIEGEGGFLQDGEAEPSSAGPVADAGVTGPGAYDLRMSNVDDQLRVWVNDRLLTFDGPTEYQPPASDAPFYQAATESQPEDPGDTSPVGVGVENAAVEVGNLKVLRDIYYNAKDRYAVRMQDFQGAQLLPDAPPSHWLNPSIFANRRQIYFVLGEEQYFPLGDNSPYSSDARMWDPPPRLYERPRSHHYVKRELFIGEALLLYWPRFGLIR